MVNLTREPILEIAHKIVTDFRPNHPQNDSLLNAHLPDTYDISYELANILLGNYPQLEDILDPLLIAAAGGLHDVGRALKENQAFHEVRGARYIRDNAIRLGLASNIEGAIKLALIFQPHGCVYECLDIEDSEFQNPLQELEAQEPLIPRELIPLTISQAIISYAEMANSGKKLGERTEPATRLNEAAQRYSNQGSKRGKAIINGTPRRLAMCEQIELLVKREISQDDARDCIKRSLSRFYSLD